MPVLLARPSGLIPTGLLLTSLVSMGGCLEEPPLIWHEEPGIRWAAVTPRGEKTGFKNVPPSSTGITFENTLSEETLLKNRHTMNGSGVAAGDIDGDGWPDLYFASLEGQNTLYRNRGGWRFEDITEAAGVGLADRVSTGAAFADLDGDGDLDLIVTALGSSNTAFLNDGTGHFTEITETAGLASNHGSTSLALSDVDGDGDLDLYIANYKKVSVNDLFPPEARTMERTVLQEDQVLRIAPPFEEHYRLKIQGDRAMRIEVAEADFFYLNDGTGRFTPVPFTEGAFLDESGRPLDSAPRDWGLSVRFQDINADGHPDLYVCNDFESPDHLWLGEGNGHFRAAPPLMLRKTSNSSMTVDFSDINRDGLIDFFLADMLSRDYSRRQREVGMTVQVASEIGAIENRPQVIQNTLFLNRGDHTFAEIAHLSGVAASEWTWSSAFLDVDLDGYEDLLLTTGHEYDVQDADAQQREVRQVANTRSFDEARRLLLDFPPLALKNIAFRNQGDLTFAFQEDGWGFGNEADVSHGLALADLDQDGDLDLITNRLNRPAALFRNDGTAPRMAIRLKGDAPNTQAIGAKIRVSGGSVVQKKEVTAGGPYLSANDPVYTFAATSPAGGLADTLVVEVFWPDGRSSRIPDAQPNRIYEIDASTAVRPPAAPSWAVQPTEAPPTRFEDRTEALRHAHEDAPFDDFGRQPLLPQRFSRYGPGIAWVDVDMDGDEDLMIGAGRTGTMALRINEGEGVFSPASPAIFKQQTTMDQTGIAVLPQPGGPLVFVGHSNYEAPPRAESWIQVLAFGPAGLAREVDRLPFGPAVVGPLTLGDVDSDGDLDLFAGGRTLPYAYPEPAYARLYRNEGGVFTEDAAWSEVFDDLGLITSAAFADLDLDGDTDLLISLEGAPIRYFSNDGTGHFSDQTAAVALGPYTGYWNGITIADFDGDGRLDIAATNAGWNTEHGPFEDAEHPLRRYYFDFDADGRTDVLEAHYETSLSAYVPDRSFAPLSFALPYLRSRIPTYTQYSTSSLREIVGPKLDLASTFKAALLAHSIFLNRRASDGALRFERLDLPRYAQFSSAQDVLAADFNGDGKTDLFLSQNYFSVPAEAPRQDAGLGLLLQGKGDGTFVPVSESITGIKVFGEQRSAAMADFNRDGRMDLVVTQHGAPTRLFQNNRAPQGLIVSLVGPPSNPAGIGATVQAIDEGGGEGPLHVISAGDGYLSQSTLLPILYPPNGQRITAVRIRWPDGRTIEEPVANGMKALLARYRAE